MKSDSLLVGLKRKRGRPRKIALIPTTIKDSNQMDRELIFNRDSSSEAKIEAESINFNQHPYPRK